MTLYKNKYRNESARAQWWDYGWAAAYFVTICTKNRIHYFGEIINKKMNLTPAGAIADVLWHEIKNHAHDVELDAFVVMPNHIHGILVLKNDLTIVRTGHALSQPTPLPGANRFQNPGKNTLSSIIGSYKSAVTRHIRRLGYSFDWQSRFHDHIIRDDAAYQRIANYIETNPENWKDDSKNSDFQFEEGEI
jgi:putative transposase